MIRWCSTLFKAAPEKNDRVVESLDALKGFSKRSLYIN